VNEFHIRQPDILETFRPLAFITFGYFYNRHGGKPMKIGHFWHSMAINRPHEAFKQATEAIKRLEDGI
jgi:hypothetical protein